MWYKNITGRFFELVTKHACDGRTDGQNYDSQDRASIDASSGKNQLTLVKLISFFYIFAHWLMNCNSETIHIVCTDFSLDVFYARRILCIVTDQLVAQVEQSVHCMSCVCSHDNFRMKWPSIWIFGFIIYRDPL